MDISVKTPIEAFLYYEKRTPNNTFLMQPVNGAYHQWTFKQAGVEIRKIASALRFYNLEPASNIAILSKNCAHWIMADLAIWMAGHVSVPLYPTLSSNAINGILEHSNAKVLFVGKLDDASSQLCNVSKEIRCASFTMYGERVGDQWDELCAKHEPVDDSVVRHPNELATIKYTSGTTGNAKGVMITFGAIHHAITNALQGFALSKKGQRFFSYLPLSHVAERMLIEMGAIYSGATIYFSESLEKFPHNLAYTQPTIFVAVPRIWEKFKENIEAKIPKLDLLLNIPIVRNIVKRLIKKKLGLSKAKWIFTGAAPISVQLLKWFEKIDIKIHEVYGMTENLAYSHINLRKVKFGSVGQPWHDVKVRISAEGEIQVKHKALLLGYYNNAQLTAEVLCDDGFLKTGDKGEIDAEGFLTITGRIKDQFKTDKAKFVDPAPIEMMLLDHTDIAQVCVVGIGIPQPIALLILTHAAKSESRDVVNKSITEAIESVNLRLQSYECIKKAVILKDEWTIESGLLTPTLKIKRNEVENLYSCRYYEWYNNDQLVTWEW